MKNKYQNTQKNNELDFERKLKKPKQNNKFDPARKNKKHFLQYPYENI